MCLLKIINKIIYIVRKNNVKEEESNFCLLLDLWI